MPKIVELAKGTDVLILGNGDILSIEQAERVCRETGCDGVMIGRAIFGNPWVFNRERKIDSVDVNERLDTMLEHCRLYEEVFGEEKKFLMMRKHLMAYASGFPGAKELRMSFENVYSADDVVAAVESFRARQESIGRTE
jgi:tRNA-dihydrouridine synthase